MTDLWKPSVTVAAIIERNGYFLLIEENTSEGVRLNQPAGHLDPNESLEAAVIRETMEETAHDFTPTALVGTYLTRAVPPRLGQDITYLRFAFCGQLGQAYDRPLDDGILRTLWMSAQEIRASVARHRSPLVLQCIEDYLAGQRSPLRHLFTHPSILKVAHD